MTKQYINHIQIHCTECDGYWTPTQLENNSHKCRKDMKEKKMSLGEWVWYDWRYLVVFGLLSGFVRGILKLIFNI